jgi:pimeloyl-ACP methyl ester carboxylesterase
MVHTRAVLERLVVLPGRGRTVVFDYPGRPGAPAVVLVHGVTLTAELNWSAVMPGLAGPFQVLAFDQRGHGDGLRWTGGYRLEDCADDLAAVAAALGIDRLIVVGYSMGGLIAQLVWQRHRQLVAGLVLCATARNIAGSHVVPSAALLPPPLTTPGPGVPGWAMPGLGTAAPGTTGLGTAGLGVLGLAAAAPGWLAAMAVLRADLLGRYLLDAGGDPARRAWALAQMRRTPLASALAAVSAVYQFTSHTWAGDIDVPTAVIIPRRDRVIPPIRQHTLAAAIPAAVTHELDGDHGLFLTAPDRLLTALRATCHLVNAHAHAAADTLARPATAS